MPAKRYIVSLTTEERQTLEQLTKTGKAAAAKINHARILLKADVHHPDGGWKDRARRNSYDPYCLVLIIFRLLELAECGFKTVSNMLTVFLLLPQRTAASKEIDAIG
jgi:hypothetical protein